MNTREWTDVFNGEITMACYIYSDDDYMCSEIENLSFDMYDLEQD